MEQLALLHPAAQVAVPVSTAIAFVGFWYLILKQ